MSVAIVNLFLFFIAGSSHLYVTYHFIPTNNNSCSGLALCSSHLTLLNDICFVQYSIDPSYHNVSPSIRGQINTPFDIPLLQESTTYYYQVSVAVNGSLRVIVQGIQITEVCNLGHNQVLADLA